MKRVWVLLGLLALILAALFALWAAVTQPLLRGPTPAPHEGPRADPQRLRVHVEALSGEIGARDYASDGLDRAAGYAAAQLRAAGGAVENQRYEVRGRTMLNIVATFGPETPERIVVGAHYDTFMDYPGADDNASGVAGLLELARMLGQAPPSLRVELVAFTLEEPPFFRTDAQGSAVHAESLRAKDVRVRAMLNLEMIGCFSDAPGSQAFPLPLLKLWYPDTGNFIVVVGQLGRGALVRDVKRAMRGASDLPVHSINAPAFIPGVDFSDHLSYWERGYPAVMITDTAFYRNPRYHTAQDTPATLDYARMAKVTDGVHAAVRTLAR